MMNLMYIVLSVIIFNIVAINAPPISIVSAQQSSSHPPYLGVDMSGFYTRDAQARNPSYDLPANYFEESFRILSEAGMNHVRFVVFWESYVKDPTSFMNELNAAANAAD